MSKKIPHCEARFVAKSLRTRIPSPSVPGKEEDEIFIPSDEKTLKSRILLEVVTNQVVHHGQPLHHHDAIEPHPRGHTMELTRPLNPTYERYRYINVFAGPCVSNLSRQQKIAGSLDYDASFEFINLGKTDAALVPVLCPDEDLPQEDDNDITPLDSSAQEYFLWVDLTYPLLGIYIPKHLEENTANPEESVCVYSHFNFRVIHDALRTYTYVDPEKDDPSSVSFFEEPDIPLFEKRRQQAESKRCSVRFKKGTLQMGNSPTLGWGVKPKWTARFDIKNLRDIEDEDPSKYIALFNAGCLVITKGGVYGLMTKNVHTNPVHTMNLEEVVHPMPPKRGCPR